MSESPDPKDGASRPLCFVLVPSGRSSDAIGKTVDFDAVYDRLLRPAIDEAGLQPIRADEKEAGGTLDIALHERLILCDVAVIDLSLGGAIAYYALGVRHATSPGRTVAVCTEGSGPSFDIGPAQTIPYRVETGGLPADVVATRRRIKQAIERANAGRADTSIFDLLGSPGVSQVSRLKTDVFRERVTYAEDVKRALTEARDKGLDAVNAVKDRLGPIRDAESGVVIDLLLSFRAVQGWTQMITLYQEMAERLARSTLVREQYAFALNRAGESEKAEDVILRLLEERGPSSETCGILGRIYKDRWERARETGERDHATVLLDRAIEAYVQGFEADWRDAYPGVNAVSLMEQRDPPDPRRSELIPVVVYSVKRRIASGHPDYWDHATLLELAVLQQDRAGAMEALDKALTSVRERWEPETTLRNIRLIRECRSRRGEDIAWVGEIEKGLDRGATAESPGRR